MPSTYLKTVAAGALCAAVAVAAPARAETPDAVIRLMVIDFEAKGVDASLARTLTDTVATALAKSGRYSVASQDDVASMLRHSEEQQLAGCADEKCVAGLGQMLGAEVIVHGSVGKVGEAFVLNVSRIDAAKGTVTDRVMEKAGNAEALLDRVDALARGLIGKVGTQQKRDAVPVEFVRTRSEAVWATVQHDKARKARLKRPATRYVARFGSEHFGFAEYDALDGVLPLKPDLWFPGKFPSCFGRTEPYEDAFSVKEERPLVIKVGETARYDLVKLHRRRKLVLDVEFEIVGARIYPMREYDWRSCDDDARPFQPSDIAPNAWVRVKAAVLRDMFNGRAYAVTRQKWDPETEAVVLESLPEPPEDPQAPVEIAPD